MLNIKSINPGKYKDIEIWMRIKVDNQCMISENVVSSFQEKQNKKFSQRCNNL